MMKNNAVKNDLKDEIIQDALQIKKLLEEKKANNTVSIDLRLINSFFDCFIITTGSSRLHCRGLCKEVEKFMLEKGKKSHNRPDLESEWIILDYDEIVVHIFTKEKREYYDLEKLWGDGMFL